MLDAAPEQELGDECYAYAVGKSADDIEARILDLDSAYHNSHERQGGDPD